MFHIISEKSNLRNGIPLMAKQAKRFSSSWNYNPSLWPRRKTWNKTYRTNWKFEHFSVNRLSTSFGRWPQTSSSSRPHLHSPPCIWSIWAQASSSYSDRSSQNMFPLTQIRLVSIITNKLWKHLQFAKIYDVLKRSLWCSRQLFMAKKHGI